MQMISTLIHYMPVFNYFPVFVLVMWNNAEKITRSVRIYLKVTSKTNTRRPIYGKVNIYPYSKKIICSSHSTPVGML